MNTSPLIACLFSILIVSCNQKQASNKSSADLHPVLNQCFASVFAKDSATLKMNDTKGKVTGVLHLMFSKKEDMNGDIAGEFRGDTLFVDFTYKMGKGNGTFKNPFAFLRKDGKLYQGYGEIVTQYGRTFFKKDTPITFDRGFVFEKVACR